MKKCRNEEELQEKKHRKEKETLAAEQKQLSEYTTDIKLFFDIVDDIIKEKYADGQTLLSRKIAELSGIRKKLEENPCNKIELGLEKGFFARRNLNKKSKVQRKAEAIANIYLSIRDEFQKEEDTAFPSKKRLGKLEDEGSRVRKMMFFMTVLNECHKLRHLCMNNDKEFEECLNKFYNDFLSRKKVGSDKTEKENKHGLGTLLNGQFLTDLNKLYADLNKLLNLNKFSYEVKKSSPEEIKDQIQDKFENFFKKLYSKKSEIIDVMGPVLDYNWMLVFAEPKIKPLPFSETFLTEEQKKERQEIWKKNNEGRKDFENNMKKFGQCFIGKYTKSETDNRYTIIARNDFKQLIRLLKLVFFKINGVFPDFLQSNYGKELKKQFVIIHVFKTLNWQFHPAIKKLKEDTKEECFKKLLESYSIRTVKELLSKNTEKMNELIGLLRDEKISDKIVNQMLEEDICDVIGNEKGILSIDYRKAKEKAGPFVRELILDKKNIQELIETLILKKSRKGVIQILLDAIGCKNLAELVKDNINNDKIITLIVEKNSYEELLVLVKKAKIDPKVLGQAIDKEALMQPIFSEESVRAQFLLEFITQEVILALSDSTKNKKNQRLMLKLFKEAIPNQMLEIVLGQIAEEELARTLINVSEGTGEKDFLEKIKECAEELVANKDNNKIFFDDSQEIIKGLGLNIDLEAFKLSVENLRKGPVETTMDSYFKGKSEDIVNDPMVTEEDEISSKTKKTQPQNEDHSKKDKKIKRVQTKLSFATQPIVKAREANTAETSNPPRGNLGKFRGKPNTNLGKRGEKLPAESHPESKRRKYDRSKPSGASSLRGNQTSLTLFSIFPLERETSNSSQNQDRSLSLSEKSGTAKSFVEVVQTKCDT